MRCADRRFQRGAAVVLAMLAVALAAGVAAAVLSDFGRTLDSAEGRHDQAQARLLARGAADWARNVLADDAQRTSVDHLKEPWAIRVPPTPVGEGEVGGEIQDWSGRFNLNNVAPRGKPEPVATAQFERLLSALGVAPADAARLARNLAEWIAIDLSEESEEGAGAGSAAAAAPGGPLLATGELRLVPGFDDELIDRLAPYLATLPAPSKTNVNTAPAEVLFSLVSGLRQEDARVLVAERERAWFKDVADFSARLPAGATADAVTAIDVKSRHFLVTGRSRFGTAVVRMEVLLDRRETWPDILWQRIL